MSERNPSPPGPPDLQILVRREDPKKLVFDVRSDLLGFQSKEYGFLTLEGDPKALAQDELGRQVDALSDQAMKGERGREGAQHQLADMGVALFQTLPKDLQKLRSEGSSRTSSDSTSTCVTLKRYLLPSKSTVIIRSDPTTGRYFSGALMMLALLGPSFVVSFRHITLD